MAAARRMLHAGPQAVVYTAAMAGVNLTECHLLTPITIAVIRCAA
jgi:hypothetical protein